MEMNIFILYLNIYFIRWALISIDFLHKCFRESEIDLVTSGCLSNFSAVFNRYNRRLRKSLKSKQKSCLDNPNYYTYGLLDGRRLYNLIKSIEQSMRSGRIVINRGILQEFSECFIYIGKGTRNRKISHLMEVENYLLGKHIKIDNKIKAVRILKCWARGHGVSLIQLGFDTNNYEALSNEFAAIKAGNLGMLSNINNGTCYGYMKTRWNTVEIRNYGKMLLHNACRRVMFDRPQIYHMSDIFTKK